MTVRTRIAPSPTGDPHVGTAYIALVNLAFARQHGGSFVLRIEDTDRARSTAESEAAIIRSLRWLGLDWDEGPDVGGECGPYRQSERGAIYARHCADLIEAGHAFRCFCTDQRLAELRQHQEVDKEQRGYDGHCMGLPQREIEARLAAGEPHTIRMKVPREGVCTVQDAVRGPTDIPWTQVDMQILLKSDGMPTYHLANVVDDHLMGITHVFRGEEWRNSAPKHILLYRYFGWPMPQLVHLALLRNPDGSKLSKRKNPTSILWYERMGYLPEGLLNYLGILTGGLPIPDGGEERFTRDAMLEQFRLDDVSQGGPIFDLAKLDWLNGRWIREGLTDQEWGQRVAAWGFDAQRMADLAALSRTRAVRMTDLVGLVGHFFAGHLDHDWDALRALAAGEEQLLQALHLAYNAVNDAQTFDEATLHAAFVAIAEHQELKLRKFLPPMYQVLTGHKAGPPLFRVLELLGRDVVRSRLKHALDGLGGASRKQVKRWDKSWQDWQRARA